MARGSEKTAALEAADCSGNDYKCFLGTHKDRVLRELDTMRLESFVKRLWKKDATCWTGADEGQWLGWLDIVSQQLEQEKRFSDLAKEYHKKGIEHAVLLGMGGSSLCVEVMRQTFGSAAGYPEMIVLDSVVPAQVLATAKQIDPEKTVFIVASKSGSTTEPNVLLQYFYDETKKVVGDKAGHHFIAITDPGSSMERQAQDLKFAHIFHGVPTIGGRFSALSNFGMIPAAIMGINCKSFLSKAQTMVEACGPGTTAAENPGVYLGTIMGVLARDGRDKVTVVTTPEIHSLGTWLEQLIAESTGKEGKGLVPVAAETLLDPEHYGKDRLFVYIRLQSAADAKQDDAIQALEKAGNPVVTINMHDSKDLGAEFFRWEVATATAGHIIGINTFNQPNVQESKDFTKEYLKEYDDKGKLPENKLLFEAGSLKLYADEQNGRYLESAVGSEKNADKKLTALLEKHIGRLKDGDYFAINAYIHCCPEMEEKLQVIRDLVQSKFKVATTVGFGPRFLHSTGQLHKGGPNSGVFLQITSDDAKDLEIPKEKYSFGILKEAQSLGDFKALSSRDRRLLRVHLPKNVESGLKTLTETIKAAFS